MSITLKNVRRQVAGFSLAMMIASMFAIGVAQAATFSDVQATDWSYPFVEDLAAQGILDTTKTSYLPGTKVNRAEMAKLAVEAWDLTLETPTEPPFKDVSLGQWYTPYIYTALKNNIIGGYKNNEGTLTGYFGPGDSLTREQAMKIIVLSGSLTTNTKGGPHFSDVPLSRWSYEYVETGYNWSVVDGFPGTSLFKPEDNVLRDQIAKMVSNGLAPVVRPGAGFNVDDAYATSLTEVTVCFSGDVGTGAEDKANYDIKDADGVSLNVTDASVATDPMCVDLTTAAQTESKNYDLIVSGVMSSADEELDIADISFTGFSAVGTGGDLTCTAGEQPAGVSVPKGSTGIPFTVVNCMASGDTAVISSMTFHRFGAGDEADFLNVYLYEGDNRLTTGRSINSETQNVEFTGLNLEVGSSAVSLVLSGDIAAGAAAASQHAFELVNSDAVSSNASAVDGDFPIQGNLMTISGATAGSITITKNGSLDELTIGETGRLAQFELAAGGTEAMELNRIALYVRGTCASSNIEDLKLYVEGGSEVLAETATVGAKDLATFVLADPFVIGQGDSKIFYVEGQAMCRNNENVRMYLDETTDLNVVGGTYGTGVRVIDAAYDGGDLDAIGGTADDQYSYVLVKGSDFNVAFNGPTAGDVAVAQKQVSCLDLTLTNASGSDLEIRNWELTLALQGAAVSPVAGGLQDTSVAGVTTPNYSLIKLVKKNADGTFGSTLLGSAELDVSAVADATQTRVLAGTNTLYAGTTVEASVIFDVANQPLLNGDKVRCTLDNLTTAGKDYVRDENGDALGSESITPASTTPGNIFTLSASALTIATSTTPSSRALTRGTVDAEILGLAVTSGSSLSNTLKSISLQGYVDNNEINAGVPTFGLGTQGGVNLNNIVDSNVALYDGMTKVSSFENVNATTGTVVFNNLNIEVAKSSTKNLTLKGHISNNAPFGGANNRIKFAITAAANVTAIDQAGRNVAAGSINVANAANGGTNAPVGTDVVMTIIPSGSGTTGSSTSTTSQAVFGGAPEFDVAKWSFTSTNADSLLKDLQFMVLNASSSSISKVKLYKGTACTEQVGNTSGYTPLPSGIVNVTDLNQTILQSTSLTLCAKVLAGTVNTDGVSQPTDASAIGLGLLNVTEVTSGSGENIAQRYTGTVIGAGSTLTTAINSTCTNFAAVVPDPGCGVTVLLAATLVGDVIQVEGEMMLVTVGGVSPTVVRGFANTAASSHVLGAEVRLSTLATRVAAAANVVTGDIYRVAAGGHYCVATSAAGATSLNLDSFDLTVAGCVPPIAGDTRFPLHGNLSQLYRSVPLVVNKKASGAPAVPVSSDTVLVDIDVTAQGDKVEFKNNAVGAPPVANAAAAGLPVNAANQLIVKLDTNVAPVASSCTLYKVTGGEQALSTVTTFGATTQYMGFNFNLSPLTIDANTTTQLQVRCNTLTMAGAAPIFNVTGAIESNALSIEWNDVVDADVTGVGALIFPVSMTGYTANQS